MHDHAHSQTDSPANSKADVSDRRLRATDPLVALYCGKSLVSRAIRWQTRSIYSHAALLLPDGSVIEAWHKGGVARNESLGAVHTPGTEVHLFEVDTKPSRFPFPALDWNRATDFARLQVGKPYDFRGVLRFISRRNTSANGDGTLPNRWFCSELVIAAIAAGGLNLLERIEADEVSPALLSLSPFLHYADRVFTGKNEQLFVKAIFDRLANGGRDA